MTWLEKQNDGRWMKLAELRDGTVKRAPATDLEAQLWIEKRQAIERAANVAEEVIMRSEDGVSTRELAQRVYREVETLNTETWEPMFREHDKSIKATRKAYGDPYPGTWADDIPIAEISDNRLLAIARRLLFGSVDDRRRGRELPLKTALKRIAAFPWIWEELIRRGERTDKEDR
jgi:hypothetical protein